MADDLLKVLREIRNSQAAQDQFDEYAARLGQNHPGNRTLHRSKKSAKVKFRKGGMVKNGRDYCK